MRKKTEARTRKQTTTSVPQPMGLTVRENQNPQSAGAKPALDSRSHRTESRGRGCGSRSPHHELQAPGHTVARGSLDKVVRPASSHAEALV